MRLFRRFYLLSCSVLVLNAHAECSKILTSTTPNEQFTIGSDGTVVLDKATNLMWMRCSLGQEYILNTCAGTTNKIKWLNALTAAEKSTVAGFSDWRLPNKNEINTIIELSCHMPTINSSIFPSTASLSYWTSSPYDDAESYIWSANFSNGVIFPLDPNQTLPVRLVRSN